MLRCNHGLWTGVGNRVIRVSLGIRGRRLRPGLVREREPGCGTVFGFDYLRRNEVQIGRFYANQAGAERVDTGSGNGGLDTPVSGLVEWTGDGEMEREGRVNDRVEDSDSANVVESSETPNETPDESPAPDTVRAFKDREKQLEERGIMQIAMAGSSRRVREESGDAIRGKLSEVAIRSELKWLKDPRALADRVARLLNVDDLASAAGMVRMAQKQKRPCVVAWNHIFEYTLKKNVPAAAFRFYNDMKKRGQKPNSKTYTIMLKGLSRVDPSPRLDPVKTALSIYRSITAENSAVRLNVIHTNAMIEVCTRQGDMNTLWRVAGGMPEEGNGSPDPFTYTAILRGIANSCRKEVEQMNPEDFNGIQEAKAKAIKEGKRVWADAIHQWVNGQPAIDGVVAQTMASLLLDGGTDQDCYHVFAMYSQITGIPIFARRPPPETPREKNETITPKQHIGAEETEDVPFVDGTGMPIEKHARKPDNYEEYMAENEETVDDVFDPISPNMAGNKPLPYLQVGNRELSTILEACMSMNQGAGAGKAYWQHLTQESNPDRVTPDPGSFDQYMRLLRLSRSSRAALELIRDEMVPAKLVDVVSFHIAFTCFLRDHRNINIFKISNELLEIMDRSVLSPDLRVLENYLKLVKILSENPHLLMSLNGLGLEGMGSSNLSLKGHYLQLRLKMAAATALRPFLHKLNEIMEHGIAPKKARGHQAKIVKKYGIQGAHALKFLNRVRLWMDEILSVPKPSPTSRNEWNQFKKDSDLLKKYSDAGMIKKYRDATVIPTDDQIMEFREKNGEAAV